MTPRHYHQPLEHVFLDIDLGFAPPSNACLTAADCKMPENYFQSKPLDVMYLLKNQ